MRAKGMRVVMDAQAAAEQLGLDAGLPLLGYFLNEGSARANSETIAAFEAAVAEARALLAGSNAEWERLRPIMAVDGQTEFEALRRGFRAGIPPPMNLSKVHATARLWSLLAGNMKPAYLTDMHAMQTTHAPRFTCDGGNVAVPASTYRACLERISHCGAS